MVQFVAAAWLALLGLLLVPDLLPVPAPLQVPALLPVPALLLVPDLLLDSNLLLLLHLWVNRVAATALQADTLKLNGRQGLDPGNHRRSLGKQN